MELEVHEFMVKAKGYDEKKKIVIGVAQNHGREGIKEFARLTGKTYDEIQRYARVRDHFVDKHRSRRQRKPMQRTTKESFILPKEIKKGLCQWD